jgi:hypothetical protein
LLLNESLEVTGHKLWISAQIFKKKPLYENDI